MDDFESYGYQIIEQLSHNYMGGRITYKAQEIETQDYVVIKQFRFATTHYWDGYKAVKREIDVLKGLNHPGIPRYLSSFDPGDGICLVQEYKNALNLAIPRSFEPQEVKEIAIQLLEILIYLQNPIPPIIHRDIKPENVLVDEQLKIYLVDFGFAKIGDGEVTALSSMMAGTPGFMPPEQRYNRRLTEASDLYGLGATLICLLTNTKSVDIGNLIDEDSDRIYFRSHVSHLNLRFIEWLEKLVQFNPKNRFSNAQAALNALQPLDLIRVPEAKLSQPILEFNASRVGEKLIQTIVVNNGIPDTVLEGEWIVLSHPNDPPHTPDSHVWISFNKKTFKGNQVQCQITVDTSQLMPDEVYRREVILNSNSGQETQHLIIKVKTAPLTIDIPHPPYFLVASILLLFAILGRVLAIAGSGAILGAIWVAFLVAFVSVRKFEDVGVAMASSMTVGGIVITVVRIWATIDDTIEGTSVVTFAIGIAFVIAITIMLPIGDAIRGAIVSAIKQFEKRGFRSGASFLYLLLTIILGITLGVSTVIGWLNPYILATLILTGSLLGAMLFSPPIKKAILIDQYRRREKQLLIKP